VGDGQSVVYPEEGVDDELMMGSSRLAARTQLPPGRKEEMQFA
jgi:hypothetical protein